MNARIAVYADVGLPQQYVQQIKEVLNIDSLARWDGHYPIRLGTPDSGLVRGDTVLVFSVVDMNQKHSSLQGSRDVNDVLILFARLRFRPAAIDSMMTLAENVSRLDAEHISIEMNL